MSPTTTEGSNCSGSDGRPERPLPLGSIVRTRAWRASHGTWAFQSLLCAMLNTGGNVTAASPLP